MTRYYDMDGNQISRGQMIALFNDDAGRRVGWDEIGDVRVSTVLLVLDHGWGDGPPLIFETMIFGGEHDEEQWRYSTREEAEEGHRRAVALVKGDAA